MPKSAVRPMNSSKNKLNSEIILIFHFNPNTLKSNLGFCMLDLPILSIISIRQGL